MDRGGFTVFQTIAIAAVSYWLGKESYRKEVVSMSAVSLCCGFMAGRDSSQKEFNNLIKDLREKDPTDSKIVDALAKLPTSNGPSDKSDSL